MHSQKDRLEHDHANTPIPPRVVYMMKEKKDNDISQERHDILDSNIYDQQKINPNS
jgi:hypothetical protein